MLIKDNIKRQVVEVIEEYVATIDGLSKTQQIEMKAAMLSGMSLVSAYLAKHDGSKDITAQLMESAIADVGKELNLGADKIDAVKNRQENK